MLGLLDAFVGGAFSKASILALGIMPYISASIFMQLMTILVPQMQKFRKKVKVAEKKSTSGHVTSLLLLRISGMLLILVT